MSAFIESINVPEPPWIKAARHVVEHGCAMIHFETGDLMPDERVPVTCERCESWEKGSPTCPDCGETPYAGEGIILDHFSAGHLVELWDALNLKNRAKFASLELAVAVHVMWGVFEKARAEARSAQR